MIENSNIRKSKKNSIKIHHPASTVALLWPNVFLPLCTRCVFIYVEIWS